jgi:hypothetical protein
MSDANRKVLAYVIKVTEKDHLPKKTKLWKLIESDKNMKNIKNAKILSMKRK